MDPARRCHQREPKKVGFLNHIYTRVWKIFFNLISHITHISYRIYVRMHLHQIRRQLVTIWSRNFHLRVRFAEKYAKSNRILQKRTAYHGQKWQTVLRMKGKITTTIGKRLRTTSVVCVHIIPENCQNQQGRNFNDFFSSCHMQYN